MALFGWGKKRGAEDPEVLVRQGVAFYTGQNGGGQDRQAARAGASGEA